MMSNNNATHPRLVTISMDEHLKKEPELTNRWRSVLDPFEDDIRRGVELGVTQEEIKRWLSLNGVEVGRTTITRWLHVRNITRRRSKSIASEMDLENQGTQKTHGLENGHPTPTPETQKAPKEDVSNTSDGLTPWDPRRPKKVDFSKFLPK